MITRTSYLSKIEDPSLCDSVAFADKVRPSDALPASSQSVFANTSLRPQIPFDFICGVREASRRIAPIQIAIGTTVAIHYMQGARGMWFCP